MYEKCFDRQWKPAKKNGNTSWMAKELLINIHPKQFAAEIAFLYGFEIKPCTDCRACKQGNLECTVNDGMKELYPKIENADVLVVGSPIYWFGPSAQSKLFLDRLRPYYGNKKN